VADRDAAGRRKVRLMTIWVGIGVALMVIGAYSSVWIVFLGASVIGSTPVYFTLRAALAPRQTRKGPPTSLPAHRSESPPRRRPAPLRRRDHG
jgi:hypothetical protein